MATIRLEEVFLVDEPAQSNKKVQSLNSDSSGELVGSQAQSRTTLDQNSFARRDVKKAGLILLLLMAILGLVLVVVFSSLKSNSSSSVQQAEQPKSIPVPIEVTASQLQSEKAVGLAAIQSKGIMSYRQAGLYLLDLRNFNDFTTDNINGSSNKPVEKAKQEQSLFDGVDLVIYSYANDLTGAQEAAAAITKNSQQNLELYKNPGKVIIVKDGYEGLKNLGLLTGPEGLN